MFGFFTNAIENVFDIGEGLVDGEMPSKRQMAKMLDAGLTIYAISEITGIAVDALENNIEE